MRTLLARPISLEVKTMSWIPPNHLPFHDRANVNTTVASLMTLADDRDAQEVDRIHVERDGDDIERHGRVGDT